MLEADDGTVEQETLYLKWCNKGIISNRFICIGEPESTTSNDLYNLPIFSIQVVAACLLLYVSVHVTSMPLAASN
jgi:hypothetical protein